MMMSTLVIDKRPQFARDQLAATKWPPSHVLALIATYLNSMEAQQFPKNHKKASWYLIDMPTRQTFYDYKIFLIKNGLSSRFN